MLTNYDPDWNIDDLTDTEIYAAIRYLEAGLTNGDQQEADDNGAVICACLYAAVLVSLAFLWFYWR
jgi:hypothetical protein